MVNGMRSLAASVLGVSAVIRSIEKALCMVRSTTADGYCRLMKKECISIHLLWIYLLYSSSHPKHIFNSIPFSQFLRLRHLCSDDNVFFNKCIEMRSFFILSFMRLTLQWFSRDLFELCLSNRFEVWFGFSKWNWTIIENGLFCGGEQRKPKYAYGDIYLIEQSLSCWTVKTHFKYWLSSIFYWIIEHNWSRRTAT